MTKDTVFISPRATAIAKGLAVTGPAGDAVVIGNWLKAQARRGNRSEFYFIDIAEGAWLLRGTGLSEASELTSGFATAAIGRHGDDEPSGVVGQFDLSAPEKTNPKVNVAGKTTMEPTITISWLFVRVTATMPRMKIKTPTK
jgi:hypothetical protein